MYILQKKKDDVVLNIVFREDTVILGVKVPHLRQLDANCSPIVSW
jgi:hypothetical protein